MWVSTVRDSTPSESSQTSERSCSRDWARPLLERFDIPTGILPPIVAPGTILGPLRGDVAADTGLRDTRVVAPGSHDTASAVVGAPLAGPTTAFLSSGTWSLIGLEVAAPVITDVTLAANLTNEGGVEGSIRLLRNVMGLWLVQESRRALWPGGDAPSYEDLAGLAEAAPSFTAFIDPDDERFLLEFGADSETQGPIARAQIRRATTLRRMGALLAAREAAEDAVERSRGDDPLTAEAYVALAEAQARLDRGRLALASAREARRGAATRGA